MFAYITPDKNIFCISATSILKKGFVEVQEKEVELEDGTTTTEQHEVIVMKDNPDIADMQEIEYPETIQNPEYKDGKIIDATQESREYSDKKARITQLLVTSDEYEDVDTEWVTFSKSDIWPMIIARFFGGDPNAEMAYLQRWNYLKDIERSEVQEVELEIIKGWYEAKEEFKNFIQSLT